MLEMRRMSPIWEHPRGRGLASPRRAGNCPCRGNYLARLASLLVASCVVCGPGWAPSGTQQTTTLSSLLNYLSSGRHTNTRTVQIGNELQMLGYTFANHTTRRMQLSISEHVFFLSGCSVSGFLVFVSLFHASWSKVRCGKFSRRAGWYL